MKIKQLSGNSGELKLFASTILLMSGKWFGIFNKEEQMTKNVIEFLENFYKTIDLRISKLTQAITNYIHSESKSFEINKETDILIAEINFFGEGVLLLKLINPNGFEDIYGKYLGLILKLNNIEDAIKIQMKN